MSHKQLLFSIFFLVNIILNIKAQQPEISWQFELKDMAFGNSAMADVDGDGSPELVFSTYRNDERIIVLNAQDGSILWEFNTGGCNDVAPLIFDVDMDGELEIILPGSCNPKTFCFDAASGAVEWVTPTHGSDSPPTVADLDNDGKLEILHGEFNGWVLCLNGEDGSIEWNYLVDGNSWIQTAPTILDVDMDGQLDFVVGNWSFGEEHRLFAFRGNDHSLIWESDLPDDVMYHGAAHSDIDNDGYEELIIGDYSGQLLVLNAEDGTLQWSYSYSPAYSIAAPVNIADFDRDGDCEIQFIDWFRVGLLDSAGDLIWTFNIPGNASSFRGSALSDINGDEILDVVFATSDGKLYGVNGDDGTQLWMLDLKADYGTPDFSFDHAPVIGDFDLDGDLDVFVIGGHAEYPEVENNYGVAYAISLGQAGGPDWPMFRYDERRTSSQCKESSSIEEKGMVLPLKVLYYSPTSQELVIENHGTCYSGIKIFDMQGRSVCSFTGSGPFDVSDVEVGFYYYWIQKGSRLLGVGKVVIY